MMVRTRGLEPPQDCSYQNLNLARLPIPPCPQVYFRSGTNFSIYSSKQLIHNTEMLEPESNKVSPAESQPVEFQSNLDYPKLLAPPAADEFASKVVQLTRGRYAIIDAADFERVSRYRWSVHGNGCGQFYAKSGIVGLLHRFILNAPADMFVDHRNGDGLDCRRGNLRTCEPAQNNFNRKWRVGPSGFRGVSRRPSGRWRAKLKCGGETIYCGLHDTPEAAALAYDAAAREHFGEFSRPNFPAPEVRL